MEELLTKEPEPALPGANSDLVLGIPSRKRQSWGALLSIVVIVLMVLIGAFYAWGKRIADQNKLAAPSQLQQ